MLDLNSIIKSNEPLSKHCSYKTGGPARFFAEPKNNLELMLIWNFLQEKKLRYLVIGNGTNVLFDDAGFDGLILSLKKLNRFMIIDKNILTAGSGILLDDMVLFSIINNLSGIEHLSGIPGTVGGAIYMNAGAFDTEIKDVLYSVEIFKDGEFTTLKASELSFSYRKSSIKDEIVVSGSFKLNFAKNDPHKIRDDILNKRGEKQPLEYPSCGSVFKRPPGTYAGKLIEECGLKGFSIGGAKVSEKHSNFIINFNNASSKDIKDLISHVKMVVFQKTGIMLEEEVKIIER
ncbi:UDP-N-acetylmuramate dehydrogenase [Calditerrivibrio nitroreducens]|uniref:UDP-N-acetylenolpyruvoylglucosamine reductase n=1 Tax=Calditerrivibrio nitroreducens (strain DSM 19672 / NBRC 101217 / Yu37-1) TaxID=768670 RepID=E4TIT8_CALNY|nr:UDP-N-acetylmuramate dehydrogenase [Calditerrivibrio nitroreducens]ADR18043.1 UDP-N-acetylenolpyruvoylglucosamine reductase [Calditerrivibrio nitroreducens DSM 19672]